MPARVVPSKKKKRKKGNRSRSRKMDNEDEDAAVDSNNNSMASSSNSKQTNPQSPGTTASAEEKEDNEGAAVDAMKKPMSTVAVQASLGSPALEEEGDDNDADDDRDNRREEDDEDEIETSSDDDSSFFRDNLPDPKSERRYSLQSPTQQQQQQQRHIASMHASHPSSSVQSDASLSFSEDSDEGGGRTAPQLPTLQQQQPQRQQAAPELVSQRIIRMHSYNSLVSDEVESENGPPTVSHVPSAATTTADEDDAENELVQVANGSRPGNPLVQSGRLLTMFSPSSVAPPESSPPTILPVLYPPPPHPAGAAVPYHPFASYGGRLPQHQQRQKRRSLGEKHSSTQTLESTRSSVLEYSEDSAREGEEALHLLRRQQSQQPQQQLPLKKKGFTVYWKRWLMLMYMSLLNLLSDWTCYSVAPIALLTEEAFGSVNPELLVTIFLAANAFASACEPIILSRLGLRRTVLFGALLLMIGSIIKSGGMPPIIAADLEKGQGEWRVYLGFFLVGLSQPLYQCTPALLSASWFPEAERTMATGVALNANQLGIGFAFIFGTLLVEKSDDIPAYFGLLSIISTVAFLGTLIQFEDAPPTPPSDTARVIRGDLDMRLPSVQSVVNSIRNFNPSDLMAEPKAATAKSTTAPEKQSPPISTRKSRRSKTESNKKTTRRRNVAEAPVAPSNMTWGATPVRPRRLDLEAANSIYPAPSPANTGLVGNVSGEGDNDEEEDDDDVTPPAPAPKEASDRMPADVSVTNAVPPHPYYGMYSMPPDMTGQDASYPTPPGYGPGDAAGAAAATAGGIAGPYGYPYGGYPHMPPPYWDPHYQHYVQQYYQQQQLHYQPPPQAHPMHAYHSYQYPSVPYYARDYESANAVLPQPDAIDEGVEPVLTLTPYHLDVDIRDDQVIRSIRACLARPGFVHALVCFTVSGIVINTLSTFMDYLVRLNGAGREYTGIVGGTFQIVIMISSLIVGKICDKTRAYYSIAIGMLVLGAFGLAECGVSLDSDRGSALRWSLVVVALLVGPLQPVSTELGVDVVYPLSENTVLVIQQLFSNLLSAAFIPLFKAMKDFGLHTDTSVGVEKPSYTFSFYLLIVLHAAATVFFATFNGRYLRYEHELEKKAIEEKRSAHADATAFHPVDPLQAEERTPLVPQSEQV